MANISKIKLPDGVTYNLKDSVSGYVTTDTKNTAGAVSTSLVGSNKLYLVGALSQSTYAETGTTSGTYVNSSGLHTSGTLAIQQLGGNYNAVFQPVETLSSNRIYELPDKGGVLALTNDLPEYNVSTDTITVAGIEAGGITVSGDDDVTTDLAAGFILLTDGTDSVVVVPDAIAFSDGTYNTQIVPDTLTDNQTLTLPNDSGTIALTADIPTNVSAFVNDAGYMTGMTILSYGSSTWQNFIDAYADNKVIYTRASSNANPASGSQTRLAFMAYVNNAATPTEVEFQYYRSVSSHSASQQGDQVYVYKLAKTGGWSVITREAMSKIAVTGGLTTSYASGTITISGADKQETLVSGTNIKTINNESLLGSGNITISGGGGDTVTYTQTQTSGNELGTITINGTGTKIYAPTETDPTVPSWAKASTKPTYTASEVGALPDSTVIPTKTSDLTNDSGFITGYTETDPTVPAWAKASSKPSYAYSEITDKPTLATVATSGDYGDLQNTPTIPTVPTNVSAFTNDAGYLTSHQSIKTINSTSMVGTGNVTVQPTLVSGTNIKTINSTSLLGSGDIVVQPTLVSGTNIKTVNNESLLGSGNITVSTIAAQIVRW